MAHRTFAIPVSPVPTSSSFRKLQTTANPAGSFPCRQQRQPQSQVTSSGLSPQPAGSTAVFRHLAPGDSDFKKVDANPISWSIKWQEPIDFGGPDSDSETGSLSVSEFFNHAYLTIPPDGSTPAVPTADPEPFSLKGETLVDERVQNPTDAAYEAAVRGALSQVTSPFFKFDENSHYDKTLRTAFAPQTTIYHQSGSTANLTTAEKLVVDNTKAALQLRGKILHDMIRDVQAYASLDGRAGSAADMNLIVKESLAFHLGLVFQITGRPDEIRWLESDAGTIKQRKDVTSTAPDSGDLPVKHFNKFDDGFDQNAPSFLKVRKFEHANMIAIDWELKATRQVPTKTSRAT